MTTIEITNKLNNISLHDDLDITHSCEDASEFYFTQIVGFIEDIIMEDKFQMMQKNFMEKYWTEFENMEENKLIYTNIFNEYLEILEKFIETELNKRIPNFDMHRFETELKNKQNELDGEVFEILATFTDFTCFKNMFLDYRTMKEEKLTELCNHISVSKFFLLNE